MILLKSNQTPDAAIAKYLAATLSEAASYWKPLSYDGHYPRSGFGVTALRPYTCGISTQYWTASVTASFADWVNTTLGDNEYVIVTGIMDRSVDPGITAMQVSANGLTLPVMHVEELWAAGEQLGYFDEPFTVRPNNKLVVQIVGPAVQTDRFGLVGFEVAKRSYLINTTP